MYAVQLHDTETEEIIGSVSTEQSIDFDTFMEKIYKSWEDFNKTPENVEDYTIEDFVDFHNSKEGNIEIDYVVMDYIQLRNRKFC